MKTKFGIRNFRVFGNNGISFDLAPITILTGENSSGKSSLVKAMLLMRNYFRAVKAEPTQNPAAVQLDFSDPALKMSGFDSALSRFALGSEVITFSYVTGSDYAPYPFNVEYSFVRDSDNRTKGELKDIKIGFEGKNLLCFENCNGKLLIKHMDVRAWFEALLVCLKGIEYDKAKFTKIDSGTAYELQARSKSGEIITDWKEFRKNCVIQARAKIRPEGQELVKAIQKSEGTGLMFYFPILEDLRGLNKEQTLAFLSAPCQNPKNMMLWPAMRESFQECKADVIREFEQSPYDSFVDFLKNLEDEYFRAYETTMAPENIMGVTKFLDALFTRDFLDDFTYKSWGFTKSLTTLTPKVYAFLHMLHSISSYKTDDYMTRNISPIGLNEDNTGLEYALSSHHHLLESFQNFLSLCISEIICPCIFDSLSFVGSSFTPVQRLYSYEEDSNLVSVLKEYRKCMRVIKQNKRPDGDSDLMNFGTIDYPVGSFINKWVKKFGIAQELIIEEDDEGLGFRLFLKKDKCNKTSLADEGRGVTQIVLILLQIEVAIMQKKISRTGFVNDSSVCIAHPTLAIEEPEVSLHPCWQSRLTDLFVDANHSGVHFIVETHSEYLIRKTQAIVAGYKTRKEFEDRPFVVYYIERSGGGYDLEYTETGRFARSFGPGFFDEASRSGVEILKRERRMRDEA